MWQAEVYDVQQYNFEDSVIKMLGIGSLSWNEEASLLTLTALRVLARLFSRGESHIPILSIQIQFT